MKPAPAAGSTVADRAAIYAGVQREHPDWSPDQWATETEKRFREASAAPKSEQTAWTVATDPGTNQQFRMRTGPDGKPEYTDMAGNPIEPPKGIAHIGGTQAPGSTGADRAAIAEDVRNDPEWSKKSVGQQADEIERRFKAATAAAAKPTHGRRALIQPARRSCGAPLLTARPKPRRTTHKPYEPKGAISKPPPAPEPGTELSPEGKKYAVDIYRRTGQLPAGWGAAGIRQKNEIIDEAGRQSAAEGGGAASDLGVRADVHAETQALTTLGRTRANVRNFEETARKEADLAVSLMDKGAARGGVPLVNRWVLAGRRSVEGDPDVVKFDTAITSFKNEYARIMSAPGATGGMTSDAARAEAESLINRAGTKAQLNGVIQTMKIGMDNRIAAINDEYAATEKRIKEAGGGELAPVCLRILTCPPALSGKPGPHGSRI